ncbi:MAG: hypothetical protein WBN04_14145 [Paracoccaceae bacterium]
MKKIACIVAVLGAGMISGPVGAQDSGADAAAESQCTVGDTNGMVTLVLCPPGLDQEALKTAGEAACGERMPCGAWIWVDEAKMPEVAPDSHDKLTQEQITAAAAIWVNEAKQLITLEPVQN